MDIKKNYQIPNISVIAKAKETNNGIPKKYIYEAEMDLLNQNLKIVSDKVGWRDAQTLYFVNKDGSGRIATAWNVVNYPKGSFSELLSSAKNIYEKSGRSFNEDDIKKLITDFIKIANK